MATEHPRIAPSKVEGAATSAALAQVNDALSRLRYGAIQLIVHDGRLVQLEVTERQRFA